MQKIKPRTMLSGSLLHTYYLCYYHKRDKPSGYMTITIGERLAIVTICIKYNSHFARFVKRQISYPATENPPAVPASGSAREIVLEPGQIIIADAGQFMEYPTGKDGKRPTEEGKPEGEDGGYSIVLLYKV
jgi:hypothetical protein